MPTKSSYIVQDATKLFCLPRYSFNPPSRRTAQHSTGISTRASPSDFQAASPTQPSTAQGSRAAPRKAKQTVLRKSPPPPERATVNHTPEPNPDTEGRKKGDINPPARARREPCIFKLPYRPLHYPTLPTCLTPPANPSQRRAAAAKRPRRAPIAASLARARGRAQQSLPRRMGHRPSIRERATRQLAGREGEGRGRVFRCCFRVVISALLFGDGVGGPAPQSRVLPRRGQRGESHQMMGGLPYGDWIFDGWVWVCL